MRGVLNGGTGKLLEVYVDDYRYFSVLSLSFCLFWDCHQIELEKLPILNKKTERKDFATTRRKNSKNAVVLVRIHFSFVLFLLCRIHEGHLSSTFALLCSVIFCSEFWGERYCDNQVCAIYRVTLIEQTETNLCQLLFDTQKILLWTRSRNWDSRCEERGSGIYGMRSQTKLILICFFPLKIYFFIQKIR